MVGSSTLPPGTNFFQMRAWVYILRGSTGRHYIGSTNDLNRRFEQHQRGHTHTTIRLGDNLVIVASKEFASLEKTRAIERILKAKKNPRLAIYHLRDDSPSTTLQ
ncbi:MAG: GIY-YIG nuclease family protein [Alphaproteobacteria bacterium]|nr:GIY-YIG nuclease family protein [Alphaproteobacteria bacterium]